MVRCDKEFVEDYGISCYIGNTHGFIDDLRQFLSDREVLTISTFSSGLFASCSLSNKDVLL